jgi:hypothetical protein
MKIEQKKAAFSPITITIEDEYEAKVLETAIACADSLQVHSRYPDVNYPWSGKALTEWQAKLASMIRK